MAGQCAVRLQAVNGADALVGVVRKAAYVGRSIEYWVETVAGELFVVDPRTEAPFAVGTDVAVSFGERGVSLIPGEGP